MIAATFGAALCCAACGPSAPTPPSIPRTIVATTAQVIRSIVVTPGATRIFHGGPIVDHVSFIDRLRGKRCLIEPIGMTRRPPLRGEGVVLRASGCGLAGPATLTSFWYHTADLGTDGLRAAEEDAALLAAQLSNATPTSSPSRYFRKERAFVAYDGGDPVLLALLADLLGPAFATSR